jgi:Ras-related protein Rab-21
VYDLTDQDSFIRAQNWVKELRKVVGDDIMIAIAGNKSDLKKRNVDENQVLDYCKQVGANHFFTSAKANKGVDEAFLDLTKRIYEKKTKKMDTSSLKTMSSSTGQSKIRILTEEKEKEATGSNCSC